MRPIQLRQERDFGQKINATFQFVGQNFKTLFVHLLYTVVPFALIGGICQAIFQANIQKMVRDVTTGGDFDPSNPAGSMIQLYSTMMSSMFSSPYALLSIVFSFLTGIMMVCTVYGYMVAYEDSNEDPISLNTILSHTKKNIIPVLLTTIICGLLSVVGFILFIIPGFYLVVTFSLASVIVVREGKSVGAAISRSFQLIKDKWWSTFGLVVIMTLCIAFMGMAVALPLGIVQGLESYKSVQSGEPSLLLIAVSAITQAFSNLMSALLYVAIGFQYYNLVEKKDGVGLQQQISQIGQTGTKNNEEGDF